MYLTGKKFNRWTVIKRVFDGSRYEKYLCRCDCGTEKVVYGSNLRGNKSHSCGCYQKEVMTAKAKHGMSATPENKAWRHIKGRCHNKTDRAYENYGGRGIKVCERWRNSFENFFADMGLKPTRQHTIERIDNDKGYEPGNCKWADREEQANNKRNNVHITLNGTTHTAAQWSRIIGIKHTTLLARIRKGWTDEKALTTPVR